MALAKIESTLAKPSWSISSINKHSKLPKIEDDKDLPAIDYEKLRWLCNLDGLKGRDGTEDSTEEAHELFMNTYHQMFVKPPKKHGFPIHAAKRSDYKSKTNLSSVTHNATGKTSDSDKKVVSKSYPIDSITHDIRDYLPLLHKQRKSEHPEAVFRDNIKTLRKLLKKLPFERTASENDKIFNILLTFDFFKNKFDLTVLKELCVVAVLENWKETGFSVFGNSGIFMVLKGTVSPVRKPYLDDIPDIVTDDDKVASPHPHFLPSASTQTTDSEVLLGVGQCFGSLQKKQNNNDLEKEPETEEAIDKQTVKPYTVLTKEPNCEFMKIASGDYHRIIEQIKQREHTEKVNLLLSCGQYKLWPRQPLLQVAELIDWSTCPPNTIIASEGYKAPYIGFIKSGECHVLRQVEVMAEKKNRREKKSKQVVMGKLNESQSFAELSVLLDEPITCSVVSATQVQLGIIKPERIKELDDVTIQLFTQSNKKTFGDLSKDDIQNEYMQQELKREWNEFKHGVVVDVINACGIRPGYGKWAK